MAAPLAATCRAIAGGTMVAATPPGSVASAVAITRSDADLYAAIAAFRAHTAAIVAMSDHDEGDMTVWCDREDELLTTIAATAPQTTKGLLAKAELTMSVLLESSGTATCGFSDTELDLIKALAAEIAMVSA